MSTGFQEGVINLVASEAIEAYRRVTLTGDRQVVRAGAGVRGFGINRDAVASGDVAAIMPFNLGGTLKMVASAAIVQNAVVYGTAVGKIDDAAVGVAVGVALDAATADLDVIEVLPIDPT